MLMMTVADLQASRLRPTAVGGAAKRANRKSIVMVRLLGGATRAD